MSSTTEYRLSRKRPRSQDGEGGGGETEEREPTAPGLMASGSQRIDARFAAPQVDPWSTFEAETAEIDLPELADPPLNRVATESMPIDELATALQAKEVMDNAKTLPGFASSSEGVTIDPMPVTAVAFGEQQLLIVHRADAVELILPGGQRLTAPRASAAALAEALLRAG